MTYARRTSVSVEKSQAEVGKLLQRHGADQFINGWEAGRAMIGFRMRGRYIRMVVPLLGSNRRDPDQVARERWRAMVLVLKAKLEGVAAGVVTFEEEFLAHIVMPNNRTIGAELLPKIDQAYKSGKLPPVLLPIFEGEVKL